MSEDVRALLKAKRDETRVVHPFAAYSAVGHLRCTACNTLVKHSIAWQGHLGSKLHRNSVNRLKSKESRQQMGSEGGRGHSDEGEKERHDSQLDAIEPTVAFRQSTNIGGTEDEGDIPIVSNNQPVSTIEFEWEDFQRSVINAPDRQDVYERATLIAEPELASAIPEGFPSENVSQTNFPTNPEEELRRKEQDERELIIDRLLDEERAQEDADLKVSVMKKRLDALKRKREAARVQVKSKTAVKH